MNPIRTESNIDALLRASKALAVIAAWHELGLFEALADGPRPLAELPADARALEISVPVLKHLGLLHSDGDRVALPQRRPCVAGARPDADGPELRVSPGSGPHDGGARAGRADPR